MDAPCGSIRGKVSVSLRMLGTLRSLSLQFWRVFFVLFCYLFIYLFGLGLILQRSVVQAWSHRGLWLDLLPCVYLLRGDCCLGPALVEVVQACSGRDPWLELLPIDVSGSALLPQKTLTGARSYKIFWLVPDTTEFSGLGLPPWWLLFHICFHGGHLQRPAPVEVAYWGLLLWRSLAQVWSHRGLCLRSVLSQVAPFVTAPVWVTPSGLLLKRLLAWAFSPGCPLLEPQSHRRLWFRLSCRHLRSTLPNREFKIKSWYPLISL